MVHKENVGLVPVQLGVCRWQFSFFGWTYMTLYRHDIVLYKEVRDPCQGLGDHTTQWWLYPLSESFGFGLHIPVWLSKRLGLSRNYRRVEE